MKLSLNWLKELVSIPDDDPEHIQELITLRIAEVEEFIDQKKTFENIYTARVEDVRDHPDADTLKIADVTIDTDEPVQIVCGAPNTTAGMTSVCAKPGAVLQGKELKPATLRGVKSHGMLLSERELGISNDHSGIIELDNTVEPGVLISEALGMHDCILDIENHAITHRPDLWCHRGFARELAAVYGVEPPEEVDPSFTENETSLGIRIECEDLCSRYTGALVENITIKESPQHFKNRLLACGIRPINNIVDITNLVMMEVGEPMHAFDASLITDTQIIVRRAQEDEAIITLDGEERTLTPDNMVIADPDKAVALAGVMGGANSEISSSTHSIILEAATFDHVSIRNTRMSTGLQSEATNRFEKGLPTEITTCAVNRACELIKELIPEAEVTGRVDVDTSEHTTKTITLRQSKLRSLSGLDISLEQAVPLITPLGFTVSIKKDTADIEAPYWRSRDTSIEEDIIEDIVRLNGLENVKPVLPHLECDPATQPHMRALEKQLRNLLSGANADEVMTYSFCPEDVLKDFSFAQEDHFELNNPLDVNMKKMRRSLVPGLVQGLCSNISFFDQITIYEIGHIYLKNTLEPKDLNENEKNMLTLLCWEEGKDDIFYDTLAYAELIFNAFGLGLEVQRDSSIPDMHPNRTGLLTSEHSDEPLGYVGELSTDITHANNISDSVGIAEIHLEKFQNSISDTPRTFTPVAKYPSITREFSMIAPLHTDFAEISNEIGPISGLIRDITLITVYTGDPIEQGKKSVSFSVELRDDTKTLSDEEANQVQDKIITRLKKNLGIQLRE